eukprot:gnl/Chilomastix_cuspidata/70.p1 GENE.gnl/Chilomastix_cuspidata/70~~gnl/Chilomastix_cuspidata/70.p1  ORF type:complete len:1242 (-),score=323.98 gnl/Chilomastix_cuspidata/70:61-3255(-)
MDGFRVSHTIQSIHQLSKEQISEFLKLHEFEKHLEHFKERALSPARPNHHGSCMGPGAYFATTEGSNNHNANVGAVAISVLKSLSELTGRKYAPFVYSGHPEATDVIVTMGSSFTVCDETIKYMRSVDDLTIGVVNVVLYRPFLPEKFFEVLPPTVQRIAVLDRTKDPLAHAEPLFMDVATATAMTGRKFSVLLSGRYGLSSTNFSPSHVASIIQNLRCKTPRTPFTVGIEDDVTKLSLRKTDFPDIAPSSIKQCVFYGFGADGTVGANKSAIKIISKQPGMYAQGYFSYDSFKSGSLTVSHLRFGTTPFHMYYTIESADYTAVHNSSYLNTYGKKLVELSKPGSVLVLNIHAKTFDELTSQLPTDLYEAIRARELQVYTVDAFEITARAGMGKRINVVMQTVFFRLLDMLKPEEFVPLLKDSATKEYSSKGAHIVEMNHKCIDLAMAPDSITFIPWGTTSNSIDRTIHKSQKQDMREWSAMRIADVIDKQPRPYGLPPTSVSTREFMEKQVGPTLRGLSEDLPVSCFEPTGEAPSGSSAYGKRGTAVQVPAWDAKTCIQCNMCTAACPHAVIRPYVASPEEFEDIKDVVTMLDIKDSGFRSALPGGKFAIQISPLDCTGCGVCVSVCPTVKKGTLKMVDPTEEHLKEEIPKFKALRSLPNKAHLLPEAQLRTLRGIQYKQPLFEFHGACAGCGESPYIVMLTRIFGERLVIANATGCSSIYGFSYPYTPYTRTEEGFGPAWANSLFEDNAEFGYGMLIAAQHRRENTRRILKLALGELEDVDSELKPLLGNIDADEVWEDRDETFKISRDIDHWRLEHPDEVSKLCSDPSSAVSAFFKPSVLSMLPKFTQFVVGGDGWAYDIGYGGLDHILATGEDINILVLDTESYSNTGGQKSKATPIGAIAKFAAGGKDTIKKDLGAMAMSYGNVYVASIALGANPAHTAKAFIEAESYPGPSLIVCYAPCIGHGTPMVRSSHMMKGAVQSGYWPLYRYDPRLRAQKKNPFQLDSRAPSKPLSEFLEMQRRFKNLMESNPEKAALLNKELEDYCAFRYAQLKKRAAQETE